MKKTIFILLLIISAKANAQYTKLLDFAGNPDGRFPTASFISEGAFLYGMTDGGGTNNFGTVFKIMPDGSDYLKLLDFTGTANGSYPHGHLFSDGTYLYGMTEAGGAYNFGTLFKIKPDGTGYVKLLEFSGTANGKWPYGPVISDGTFLYGMTGQGGSANHGTIFKIKPDGTGYVKLLDFTLTAHGDYPTGTLVSDGTFLYGMANAGGANNKGTIFKIKTDGTGFVKLLDFAGTSDGRYPTGTLISDGTFLYGMTGSGGLNDHGVIFKIMPDGTGYTKLLDFSGPTTGRDADGSLVFDAGILYGMTKSGGASDMGTMFRIMPDGTGYSKLMDFSGTPFGRSPYGDLFSDGTSLYGMTIYGGTSDYGIIFKYGISTGITENNIQTSVTVFPNPATGIFTVHAETTLSEAELSVYNLLGEQIYSQLTDNLNNTAIDLTTQPNGIYFIKIETAQAVISKKVIINK